MPSGPLEDGSQPDRDKFDNDPDTDSGISELSDLSIPATLQAFLDSPRRFVLGAVLTAFLESTFGIVEIVIDGFLLVLAGSEPSTFDAPGETLGIADIPVKIAGDLGGVGESIGDTLISTVRTINGGIFEAAGAAGPLSPIVVTVIVVGEIVVALVLFRRIVYIVADLLQLGGLTE
ncbi:hypothetical protein [Halorubrum cibi]|uniref:Uncharacterized protein n=1 Tax=Halorubrum cibi TaxID=413815 RepID=A0A521ECR4_9EURY|nr:hypothetical protein [Halorubrum cibi]SMO81251.1 hypothetical protein SAMN06264867_1106 [Halorubrum cibi]